MSIPSVRTAETLLDEEEEPPSREQLLKLVDEMQRDWRHLNEIMNKTAQNYEWCDEYEERQARYNEGFSALKLEGRGANQRPVGGGHDRYLLPECQIERLRTRRYE